jgi:DNA-directed RNA polymerase specialized sigma24 family protein
MSGPLDDSSQNLGARGSFQETLWGQVFAAGKQNLPESQEAMAALYKTYSLPIYSFLRRSGHDRQKAKDLAHDFFGYLWEHNLVAKADPSRSRFRNFLIGVLKKFVLNQYKEHNTLKGGAGYQFVSIDAETAEGIYANEPATDETPETIFERHWVLTVLAQARDRLRMEFMKSGTREQFNAVEPFLTGEKEDRFASLAKTLGKSEGAVRTVVSRLRAKHRALVVEVISQTLVNKEDAEAEFQHLIATLRRRS